MYVIVLIGVAALFSLGGLVRFCHHTVRAPARTGPGTAPRSVLEVPMTRQVPEYEAKTVANPDGSFSLAVAYQSQSPLKT